MDFIKIFSPATIANISCGFDTLGVALSEIGDTMTFAKSPDKVIIITDIKGADISYKNEENVAALVAKKMLEDSKANFGVHITMHKGYAPGSGLGSSGASAAGAAFGLGRPTAPSASQSHGSPGQPTAAPAGSSSGGSLHL